MSSHQRRQELRRERDAAEEARQAEEARIAGLPIYERIEECGDIHDVKRLLHDLMDKLGINEWESL